MSLKDQIIDPTLSDQEIFQKIKESKDNELIDLYIKHRFNIIKHKSELKYLDDHELLKFRHLRTLYRINSLSGKFMDYVVEILETPKFKVNSEELIEMIKMDGKSSVLYFLKKLETPDKKILDYLYSSKRTMHKRKEYLEILFDKGIIPDRRSLNAIIFTDPSLIQFIIERGDFELDDEILKKINRAMRYDNGLAKFIYQDQKTPIDCIRTIPENAIKYAILGGHLPDNGEISYIINYTDSDIALDVLETCDLKLTEGHESDCFRRQIFSSKKILNQKSLEVMFKYYKVKNILKHIPDDLKVNQTCLHNACYLSANLAGIKIMLQKYELDLDETCLANALTHKTNTSLISFLLESGIRLDQQALLNLIRYQKMNPTCRMVLEHIKQEMTYKFEPEADPGKIEGVEDIQ